mmetsp:Transcript_83967/g.251688  ORF Transcript_83967/g.251688 Transcript_83967/m.251688 type:complete len:255 (+) Transcript_83967:577-1341(+)
MCLPNCLHSSSSSNGRAECRRKRQGRPSPRIATWPCTISAPGAASTANAASSIWAISESTLSQRTQPQRRSASLTAALKPSRNTRRAAIGCCHGEASEIKRHRCSNLIVASRLPHRPTCRDEALQALIRLDRLLKCGLAGHLEQGAARGSVDAARHRQAELCKERARFRVEQLPTHGLMLARPTEQPESRRVVYVRERLRRKQCSGEQPHVVTFWTVVQEEHVIGQAVPHGDQKVKEGATLARSGWAGRKHWPA